MKPEEARGARRIYKASLIKSFNEIMKEIEAAAKRGESEITIEREHVGSLTLKEFKKLGYNVDLYLEGWCINWGYNASETPWWLNHLGKIVLFLLFAFVFLIWVLRSI